MKVKQGILAFKKIKPLFFLILGLGGAIFCYVIFLNLFLTRIFYEKIIPKVNQHPPSSLTEPVPQPTQPPPSFFSVTEAQRYLASLKRQYFFRNPFLSQAELKLKSLLKRKTLPHLEGIILIGLSKVAIIEGKRVKEGDIIDGFFVRKITAKSVWLRKGKKTYRLTLE